MELWDNLKLVKTTHGKSIIMWPMCYALGVFEKLAHSLHCLPVHHISHPSLSSSLENSISQNLSPLNSVSSMSSRTWPKPSYRIIHSPLVINVSFSSMINILNQNGLGYQREHRQNLCRVAHGRIKAWKYLNETFTMLFYSPKFLFFIGHCQDRGNKGR